MGLFGPSVEEETSRLLEQEEQLEQVIADLRVEVKALEAVRTAETEHNELQAEIKELQQAKAKLEYDVDRLIEEHDRENREIEHKVGLHKEQVEWEVKKAREETKLQVETGNLQREKDAFKKEVEFITKRFEQEAERREATMLEILKRLPTVTVDKAIDVVAGGRREETE